MRDGVLPNSRVARVGCSGCYLLRGILLLDWLGLRSWLGWRSISHYNRRRRTLLRQRRVLRFLLGQLRRSILLPGRKVTFVLEMCVHEKRLLRRRPIGSGRTGTALGRHVASLELVALEVLQCTSGSHLPLLMLFPTLLRVVNWSTTIGTAITECSRRRRRPCGSRRLLVRPSCETA